MRLALHQRARGHRERPAPRHRRVAVPALIAPETHYVHMAADRAVPPKRARTGVGTRRRARRRLGCIAHVPAPRIVRPRCTRAISSPAGHRRCRRHGGFGAPERRPPGRLIGHRRSVPVCGATRWHSVLAAAAPLDGGDLSHTTPLSRRIQRAPGRRKALHTVDRELLVVLSAPLARFIRKVQFMMYPVLCFIMSVGRGHSRLRHIVRSRVRRWRL